MIAGADAVPRTFKTPSFGRSARRARIADVELCAAIAQIAAGRADDLGGGVFKKRLNRNLHRGILIGVRGTHRVFEYVFAKQDRDNLADDELAAFRQLAAAYVGLTPAQWTKLADNGSLVEICNEEDGGEAVQE